MVAVSSYNKPRLTLLLIFSVNEKLLTQLVWDMSCKSVTREGQGLGLGGLGLSVRA